MIACAAALASSAATSAPSAEPCRLSPSDQAWLDQSMHAWNYAAMHISGIGHVQKIQAVIFDQDCVVTSKTAMNGGANAWSAHRHGGEIELPDGAKIPVGVISFAGSDPKTGNFFVMSTPSIWRAGGKDGKGTTLEDLMTAVMLHEGSHVAQMPTYGAAIGKLAEANHLPEDFSDDSVQQQFGKNAAFTQSIADESKLLFEASNAKSRSEAARLVRAALARINARQQRWYTGKDAYLRRAEDVFLTLEGSGQWLAYRWLVDPKGGQASPAAILPGFRADKWWSQREGFAAFMALERLAGEAWKRQAFHDGQKTVVEMLGEAARRR
ncbi:MAG TPA: hypothetical protein VFP57_05800 [Sphingomicrobium sp.]|nr:hypothetical protein [Sphingomicrobium sp.]